MSYLLWSAVPTHEGHHDGDWNATVVAVFDVMPGVDISTLRGVAKITLDGAEKLNREVTLEASQEKGEFNLNGEYKILIAIFYIHVH